MKQLYKYNDLYGVVINIFEFIKQSHICDMVKKRTDAAASFACTAHYFHNIARKYILPQYRTCEIHNLKNSTKRCCRIHCKAFPILSLLYDNFGEFRQSGYFIHYNSPYIANFLPQYVPPNIQLGHRCCDGKGWHFRKLSPIQQAVHLLEPMQDVLHRNQLPAAV